MNKRFLLSFLTLSISHTVCPLSIPKTPCLSSLIMKITKGVNQLPAITYNAIPQIIKNTVHKHKILCLTGIMMGTLLTIPKTRNIITKKTRSLLANICDFLGFGNRAYYLRHPWTSLHEAVCYGTPEQVRQAINNYADIEARTERNLLKTPLMLAAERGNIEIVRTLIEAGANLRAEIWLTNVTMANATTLAIKANHIHVFRELLNAGVQIGEIPYYDEACIHGPNFRTILHWAAAHHKIDVIQECVRAHTNLNSTAERHRTALHIAVAVNDLDAVRALVEGGADRTILDDQGRTARETTQNQAIIDYLNRPL